MNQRKGLLGGILYIGIGTLIILIPFFLFPVCGDTLELVSGRAVPMRCYWTAQSELAIGSCIIAAGLIHIFLHHSQAMAAISILTAILGIIAFLLCTFLIGVCQSVSMPCNAGTRPALIIASVLVVLSSAVNLGINVRNIKNKECHDE